MLYVGQAVFCGILAIIIHLIKYKSNMSLLFVNLLKLNPFLVCA